eukprot:1137333-Pelagomonas_calceolata.AAC.7
MQPAFFGNREPSLHLYAPRMWLKLLRASSEYVSRSSKARFVRACMIAARQEHRGAVCNIEAMQKAMHSQNSHVRTERPCVYREAMRAEKPCVYREAMRAEKPCAPREAMRA